MKPQPAIAPSNAGTPTPRTDAETDTTWTRAYGNIDFVFSDFARTLERELNEAKATAEKRVEDYLNERVCCSGHECGCRGVTRLVQYMQELAGEQITALTEALRLAREALKEIQKIGENELSHTSAKYGDAPHRVALIARAALTPSPKATV